MNKGRKLLITGASGFTGQHACTHFLKAGYDVTAVTRKKMNFDDDVSMEYCDLTNGNEVYHLVKKIKPQYVLHLAGQNHVEASWVDPLSTLEVNSMSTAYLIDALRKESPTCKILIVGSALQFDLGSLTSIPHPYSLSKTLQVLIAQSWAVLYNLEVIIAKPSNLIGPGVSTGVCSIFAQKIIEMEKQGSEKVLEVENANIQRDFLDVRDAVRAYDYLLKKGKSGETYDVASGNAYSLGQIIEGYRSVTKEEIRMNAQSNELFENKPTINPAKLVNLGWKPNIPLETSLGDILTFYRGVN
ncbi:NAD-dependent epimerase/dehydratase family protein [Peribacillus muralis]|uniref:NAD-dependent epimerase/dehydratase family protein n=1 Tax=Peribacillus muralis TaxID=264697 RepID=UPI003D075D99